MGSQTGPTIDAMVWDLPTRLFHWMLVTCIAGSWLSAENGAFDWHMRFGYATLTLLLFRLIWGLVGGETARFWNFLAGPKAVRQHIRELLAPGPMHPHVGHNPLGALAVVALLGLIGVQAGSGLFTSDGILTDGPLVAHVSGAVSALMRQVHLLAFDFLVIGIGIHLSAIVIYRFWKKLDLVRPMLTGRAVLPETAAVPHMVSLRRATVVAALSIVAIVGLLTLA